MARGPAARHFRALVYVCTLVGLSPGCEAGSTAPTPASQPAVPALEARVFFATAVGDRWREQVGEASRTIGVTAQTPGGLLVTFGTRDRRPSFHRVDDEGVTLVRPDGTALEPLLRGPQRVGASFDYTSGEGPLAAPCTTEVTESGVRFEVGPIADCIVVERTCRHPEGGLFRAPTVRRSNETWCPSLGRVRTTMELEPPIEGAMPAPTTEIVHFVAAGAPQPRASEFGCEQLLVLESDIAAACGPGWAFQSETPGHQACSAQFSRGEDALSVRVSRRRSADAARIAQARSMQAAPEGTESRAALEGTHLLFVSATGGCDGDRLARLLPLLGSMVRTP